MEKENIWMKAEGAICLDRLLYVVLRSWRKHLKFTFFLAILATMLISMINITIFNSEEYREKVEQEYQMELFSHELEGESIKIDIQKLYESIQQREIYNANSLLMKIDPYNKYVINITYYVDTGYQIMPEFQYQDIDYGPRLVQMYAEYLTGGELYSELAEGLSVSHDVRFIEELFEVSVHHSMGMVEIQACAVSQEMCWEIVERISQGIKAKYEEANQLIGNHTLIELNKSVYTVVDTLLDSVQKDNVQEVIEATALLTEKREALKAWEEKTVPTAPYSATSILKTMLKVACVGAFLGILISMTHETMRYMIGNRIIGTFEFQNRFTLSVLGEIPEESNKKGPVDCWIDRIGKVTLRREDTAVLTGVTAENICMAAKDDYKIIALIGSIPLGELEYMATELQHSVGSRVKFIAAGNPLSCASAANLIDQSDLVVLVEKQGVSTYTDVLKVCQRMDLWKKDILGIVFTNVAAM